MIREFLESTIHNPLVILHLRRRGIYTWGNLALFVGVAILALASLVRFGCYLRYLERRAPFEGALREAFFRSHVDPAEIGASLPFLPLPEFFAEIVQYFAILGLLGLAAPRLVRDLGHIVRPVPLFPEEFRATPLTPRQILAAGVDAPILRLGCASVVAAMFLALPRHRTGRIFFDFEFEIHPGPSPLLVLLLLNGWALVFALHRTLLSLARRDRTRLAIARRDGRVLLSDSMVLYACGTMIYLGSFIRWERGFGIGQFLLQVLAFVIILHGVRRATDRLIARELG